MALFPLLLTFGAFRPLSTHNDFLGSFRKTSAEISISCGTLLLLREFFLGDQLAISKITCFYDGKLLRHASCVWTIQSWSAWHACIFPLRFTRHGQARICDVFVAELIKQSEPKRHNGKLTVFNGNRCDARGQQPPLHDSAAIECEIFFDARVQHF